MLFGDNGIAIAYIFVAGLQWNPSSYSNTSQQHTNPPEGSAPFWSPMLSMALSKHDLALNVRNKRQTEGTL